MRRVVGGQPSRWSVAAPVVGLFWAYVDSSGFVGFLGATVVCAAVGLWLWAVRGSEPN
jgi:hypothetical protein